MSYFDDIVKNRNLGNSGFFLWEFKLNRTEFEILRSIIVQAIEAENFDKIRREAVLYFAEWWRREFNGGHAKIKEVCESLYNSNNGRFPEDIDGISEKLYKAAKAGAEILGLQFIETQGEQREVEQAKYSIYFQGGLPMNYIINEVKQPGTSQWETFFKKLVWNLVDFSSANAIPGIIAQSSKSLHKFCENLRTAADNLLPELQPYIHEENWWNVVIKNFEEEKRARKARIPFESSWIFDLDDNDKTIDIHYVLTGSQWLSQEFIKSHKLNGRKFTSFSMKVNGTPVFTPEYNERFYCRRTVKKTIPYKIGDSVTITINETGEVLCNRVLDLDAPRIIYLHERNTNTFRSGNQQDLKDKECRIIASEEWTSDCNFDYYSIGGVRVKLFSPAMGIDKITFLNKVTNKELIVDPLKGSMKTFIDFDCACKLNIPIVETIFNAKKEIKFYVGEHEDKINTAKPCPVEYAQVGKQFWNNTPMIGRIKAKARKANNEDIEPVSFINTGNLEIKRLKSSRFDCTVEILWEHGTVSSTEATKDGNTWTIRRLNLSDGRHAHFLFTPFNTSGNQFTLTIPVPFYGFALYDKSGKEVANDTTIPFVDISDFEYFAHPESTVIISPNKTPNELIYKYSRAGNSTDCKVVESLCLTKQRSTIIPSEGQLSSLFMDGSEQIEQMLNRSCRSLPDAEAAIVVNHSGRISTYKFKRFPFRLKYDFGSQNKIIIVKNRRGKPGYHAELLAIPIDRPDFTPIELHEQAGEPNRYYLPDTILSSRYNKWLIYGKLGGYVLPILIDTQTDLNEDARDSIREEKINDLKQELLNSDIMAPIWNRAMIWFKLIPLGKIPGSSILELVAIADDNRLVQRFALLLWLDCIHRGESVEFLKAALIEFQTQMSFLWRWSSTNGLDVFSAPLFALTEQQILPLFYQWFCSLPNDTPDKDAYLTDPQYRNMAFLLGRFNAWYEDLKLEGYPKAILDNPDMRIFGNGISSDAAQSFFDRMWNEFHMTKRNIENDDWVQERHLASQYFETKNFGDIQGNEHVKREIRNNAIIGLTYKIK